jgi:phage host-nuclease inhibitor protein Gam
MRKEKFQITLYAFNRAELEKSLASKGIFPEKISSKSDLKREKIEDEVGRFIANESEDFATIVKVLKRELKSNPNKMIDYIEFKKKNKFSKGETIDPIERLEFTYSVKSFCELVGIK